jgi:GTP-sensing pleiotropic transcriptional regulator CodY
MFKKNTGLCSECFEPISNPICVNCLKTEINSWLDSQSLKIKKAVNSEIKNLKKQLKDIGQISQCIICKKNSEVCPFCLMQNIENSLRKQRVSEKKISEFNTLFNYSDFGQY